jgi:hypothetical protein
MPKLTELTRNFSIPADALDTESRTVTLTFSSEEPVDRGAYIEILSHQPGAADLTRLHSGAPLLVQHDHSDQIGVVLDAGISNGRGAAKVNSPACGR